MITHTVSSLSVTHSTLWFLPYYMSWAHNITTPCTCVNNASCIQLKVVTDHCAMHMREQCMLHPTESSPGSRNRSPRGKEWQYGVGDTVAAGSMVIIFWFPYSAFILSGLLRAGHHISKTLCRSCSCRSAWSVCCITQCCNYISYVIFPQHVTYRSNIWTCSLCHNKIILQHDLTFSNVMIWCNIWNVTALCNLTDYWHLLNGLWKWKLEGAG